ncbi:MAG: hypothetical protein HY851_12480 [candidate division Zixibacteria bacterium]|nr:hypothetical protein [candidate division Zixibacteria bacterium]
MKKIVIAVVSLLFGLALLGCEDNAQTFNQVPPAPQGVFSVTGDRSVEIVWNGVYDRDVSYYAVYRSNQATTGYAEIGRVTSLDNPNLDLIIYNYFDNTVSNGTTYYYAVSAVDRAGQESSLSAEEVFDTPRPEGMTALYSYYVDSSRAGFDLAGVAARVPWPSLSADVWIDDAGGAFYINAADTLTDLQDLGFTQNFEEIGYSPDSGWSEVGYFELIAGHTYVIWTRDNHFAKMRVESINGLTGQVVFQWAYQTDTGNPELAPGFPGAEKPSHGPEYLRAPGTSITNNM